MNRTRLIFWTDTAILCAFLVTAGIGLSTLFFSSPQGAPWQTIHLSCGILVFAGVVFHLALHRKWIGSTAKRLVKEANWLTRINFIVDFLLGWVFILICLSGLNMWLSHAGYTTLFQIQPTLWETMHRGTGTAMTIYITVHLALHHRWIKHAAGKCFGQRWPETRSFGLSTTASDHTRRILVHKQSKGV